MLATLLKSEEEKTLYKRFDENKLNNIELMENLERAGSILMVCDLDLEEKDVYLMYKNLNSAYLGNNFRPNALYKS
jgi:hypothetical protein